MVKISLDHKSDEKSIGLNIKEGTEPIVALIDNVINVIINNYLNIFIDIIYI
jgi:hypothetical protein